MKSFYTKTENTVDEVSYELLDENTIKVVTQDSEECYKILKCSGADIVLQSLSGEIFSLKVFKKQNQFSVFYKGQNYDFEGFDEASWRRQSLSLSQEEGQGEIVTPMPGKIVKLEVKEGDAVEVGQGVVVVEAMKMENEYKSPKKGIVARIDVSPGDTVEAGSVLLVIE